VPSVGLYCMELESCLNDECLTSKRINLYPWIRWNPNVVDRVMCIRPDTELCHFGVVQSLPRNISSLSVCDVGVMCDIPPVSKNLTDILSEENVNTVNDNILFRHATASHLDAADKLLSVLSEAVCLRVTYQDAKCHICLLQQHGADVSCRRDASNGGISLPHSSNISTDGIISSYSTGVDIAPECENDCNVQHSRKTGLCDVKAPSCNQPVDAVSSCCDHLCQVSIQQSQFFTSSVTSSGQVRVTTIVGNTTDVDFCLKPISQLRYGHDMTTTKN